MEEKPFIDNDYFMEKFQGKGAWTFVRIPEILKDKKTTFGWVKIKGSIDGFEIRKYHLMPDGKGGLFLPVKSEIRKKIKKQVGDSVHIILYPDNEPLEMPEEMLLCLQEEPVALKFFNSLSESQRKYYIQWIYSSKKEETKIERLAKSINRLLKKEKFYEKDM